MSNTVFFIFVFFGEGFQSFGITLKVIRRLYFNEKLFSRCSEYTKLCIQVKCTRRYTGLEIYSGSKAINLHLGKM